MRIPLKVLFAFFLACWCALALDLLLAWMEGGIVAVPQRLLHIAGSSSVWRRVSWRHVWIFLGELAVLTIAAGFVWRRAEARKSRLDAVRGGG
jgi:hypothetical protein